MDNTLPSFLQSNEIRIKASSGKQAHSLPFIDRTLKNIAGFIKTGYLQNYSAGQKGLMQKLNTWVKVLFLLGFILVISLKSTIVGQLYIFSFLFFLHLFSRINIWGFYKRIILLSFIFGFMVSAPAALNLITRGDVLFPLLKLRSEQHFWIYTIPQTIGITYEGCIVVIRFWLKVFNSLALTLLIIHTTSFNDIIKSFKMLRVPDLLLLTITLTYKFLFILSQTTEETYLALKSRWWEKKSSTESNTIIAGRISYIFRKSWMKYEEIYMAMVARGFSGKVTVVYPKKVSVQDVVFLIISSIIAVGCYII
jgi:cobalt/nickel transport system permease protein